MDKSRRKSRLLQVKQVELIKYFVTGSTVGSAVILADVNRNTATLYFHKLREEIASRLEQETPELICGDIELDGSYFGGVRKGKRGNSTIWSSPAQKANKKCH